MPYKIRKEKNRFCVFNSDTNDKKGCSDTKEEAVAHMRALYAAESKQSSIGWTDKEIDLMTLEAVREFEQVVAGPVVHRQILGDTNGQCGLAMCSKHGGQVFAAGDIVQRRYAQ